MMLRLLEQKEFSSSHSDSKASQLDMSADYNSCCVFVLQLLRLERCILLTLVTDSICANPISQNNRHNIEHAVSFHQMLGTVVIDINS